jgi:hypothetical protein
VLGPTPIEFRPLFVGQFESAFTLRVREAFPKGNGEFGPIPSREFQELRKRTGCHAPIVSCADAASQYPKIRVVLVIHDFRCCLTPRSAV